MSTRDVVLFDLDGTLVDSAPAIAQALNAIRAERSAEPIPVETVRHLVSQGVETLVSAALDPVGLDPASDIDAFRRALPLIPADESWIYPGVRAALAALATPGRTLGVLTNKPERLARKLLGDLSISELFAAIVGGDTTAFSKPHPAPMLHLLALIGSDAEKAVYVGDSIVDALSAQALHVPFFLFAGGYGAPDVPKDMYRARFDDFASLPELICAG